MAVLPRVVIDKGFLLYLVEEVKGYENAECRSYTFADGDEAILIPLPEDKDPDEQKRES
jgi:hypothetical protein